MRLSGVPSLKGRRILVTGGSSGFGRAMVLAFIKEGALAATCGRRKERMEEISRETEGKALAVQADVSNPKDVERLFRLIGEKFKGLDVLVNNAGILYHGKLLETTLEKWQRHLDVNVTGPYLACRAATLLMKGHGRIINVTSGLGFFPMVPYGAYCVSKAAVNMLTRALAEELQGTDILVNCVDPGVARTEMNREASEPPESIIAIVRALAALPEGGPQGRFFKKSGEEIRAE